MADLIKKIKIKKQDGTFTDYIPIGAEAKNITTEEEESVQTRLDKTPKYYDTIDSMKNDMTLKNGDLVFTNGKHNLADSQKSFFKIVNNVTSDDFYILLDNDLKAKKINNINNFHLYQPNLSQTIEGGCFNLIAFEDGFNILIDCGMTGEEQAVQDYLDSKNITHLDIVIITHFHADHSGCFETIARNYCDNDTLFFRQMECDWSQFGIGEGSAQNQEQIYNTVLNSLGFTNQSRIPNQNEILYFDNKNIKLRFLNTDSNFKSSYYVANSDTNSSNYTKSSLNNFSLICELTAYNKKILFNGDIEKQAQINNINYITKCDILQVPHHNWNHNGYYKFFQKIAPTIAYFNRNNELTDHFIYWSRIQKQCLGYIPTYYTLREHVEIKIGDNGIEVESGYLDESFTVKDNQKQLIDYIPYYTEMEIDYWSYANWTIKNIIRLLRAVPEAVSVPLYRDGRFTQFVTEIQNVTGADADWVLKSKQPGIELERYNNWDGAHYTFMPGFDADDSSTWSTKFYIQAPTFSNKSYNTDLDLKVGDDPISVPLIPRFPEHLWVRVSMSNGNTYGYLLKKNPMQTTQYIFHNVYPSFSDNAQYLRMERITLILSDQKFSLLECNMWVYSFSAQTISSYTGKIIEIDTTIHG